MRLDKKQIPTNKAERFKYLTEQKKQLIKIKRAGVIHSDVFVYKVKPLELTKEEQEREGVVRVKVVANTSMFCDSDMDVLLPDCWEKSIKETGPEGSNTIAHLKDHVNSIGNKLGEVVKIYTEEVEINGLTVKALIFETDIYESYDKKMYDMYKNGGVNQHSIGLQYVILDLAINDPMNEKAYKNWQMYIDQIINKEKVIENGYFWVVKEIKVFENSAVLRGANELTPTLDTSEPSKADTPPENDSSKEDNREELNKKFYLNLIQNV